MKIGIDLGGTKTEGILIDASGKELNRKRIKTEKNIMKIEKIRYMHGWKLLMNHPNIEYLILAW